MREVKFLSMFVLLVLVGNVMVPSGAAWANDGIKKIRWLTYTDPRYVFSIEYPADWQVIPRDDKGIGGTVSFSSPDGLAKIEVGLYLAERTGNTPLEKWTAQYDAVTTSLGPIDFQIKAEKTILVGGQSALRREGISTLTEFKYVNIPFGNTVWFI